MACLFKPFTYVLDSPVLSVVLEAADVGTDIGLVISRWGSGHIAWAGITIFFISLSYIAQLILVLSTSRDRKFSSGWKRILFWPLVLLALPSTAFIVQRWIPKVNKVMNHETGNSVLTKTISIGGAITEESGPEVKVEGGSETKARDMKNIMGGVHALFEALPMSVLQFYILFLENASQDSTVDDAFELLSDPLLVTSLALSLLGVTKGLVFTRRRLSAVFKAVGENDAQDISGGRYLSPFTNNMEATKEDWDWKKLFTYVLTGAEAFMKIFTLSAYFSILQVVTTAALLPVVLFLPIDAFLTWKASKSSGSSLKMEQSSFFSFPLSRWILTGGLISTLILPINGSSVANPDDNMSKRNAIFFTCLNVAMIATMAAAVALSPSEEDDLQFFICPFNYFCDAHGQRVFPILCSLTAFTHLTALAYYLFKYQN